MRLLLDTHAAVWWWTSNAALPPEAHATIADPRNSVAVSAGSAWEIGIKHRAGRWPEAGVILERWDALVADAGFAQVAITAEHAMRAAALDWSHRDPFDRVLAAQSQIGDMTLMTADAPLRAFLRDVRWIG